MAGFFGALDGVGDFFTKYKDVLGGVGSLAGGLGTAYGAYAAGKAADRNYNFNMSLLQNEMARRQNASNTLNEAYKKSNLSRAATQYFKE